MDDGLIGTQVFQLFNYFFQKEDYWFVYSNHIRTFNFYVGPSTDIPDELIDTGKYRKDKGWKTSQPKAFYNKLFWMIQYEDLLTKDTKTFYPV